MKLLKRALVTATLVLATFAVAFTTASAPAQAAYSPQVICNRHVAHRGDPIACKLRHFPKNHHGTISVRARFWVHKKHHKHRVLTRHLQTRVLASFTTSAHGNKLVAFKVPRHIKKGTHPFKATVGHKSVTFHIRVV